MLWISGMKKTDLVKNLYNIAKDFLHDRNATIQLFFRSVKNERRVAACYLDSGVFHAH